eukprot:m.1359647 g.1359647  ORF g.1359647 m.1359647 type:complete len:164 (+) comp24939_c0_seq6:306-797(+)
MQLRRQSSGDVSGDELARQSGSPTRSCASPLHRTIVPRQHTHEGVSESHTRLRRQRSLGGSQPDVGVTGGPRRSLRRKSKSSGHLAPMEPASAQGVSLGSSVSPPPADVVRAHPFLAQHGSSKTQARKLAVRGTVIPENFDRTRAGHVVHVIVSCCLVFLPEI